MRSSFLVAIAAVIAVIAASAIGMASRRHDRRSRTGRGRSRSRRGCADLFALVVGQIILGHQLFIALDFFIVVATRAALRLLLFI